MGFKMSTKIKVGDKAPDFELPSTIGEKIKLSDQLKKGPILLLFYPLDWSPVCTKELCTLRDGFTELEELGINVLAISVDSIFSHHAWAEKLGITFPLLSDFNREVIRSYDVIHEEILGLKGIAKRSVFIIDQEGAVRYRWVSEDPSKLPNMEEIRENLEKP
jgi:peroxiredoxin